MNKPTALLIFLSAIMLVSCKKHNNDPEPPEQATHVVTGKLYGKDFTFASGKASREIIDFQEEGFEIFLSSAKADGCASPDENFHVIIRTPRKVGKFPDYYAILADPASSDYAMFTDGNVFEVTSISGNTIKGYLKVTDPERNSAIEGTFEATICN